MDRRIEREGWASSANPILPPPIGATLSSAHFKAYSSLKHVYNPEKSEFSYIKYQVRYELLLYINSIHSHIGYIELMNSPATNARGETVSVVDSDTDTRHRIITLSKSAGYHVHAYGTAGEFLECCQNEKTGVVLLDLCLPDMHGAEVHQNMLTREINQSIIFHTEIIDVPIVVQSIKLGAVDFLIKPCADHQLLNAIDQGTALSLERFKAKNNAAELQRRFDRLSPREYEVLGHVVAGRLNKQIAYDLGTCEQTIKVHRVNLMKKLQVKTFLELLRLADRAGIPPTSAT